MGTRPFQLIKASGYFLLDVPNNSIPNTPSNKIQLSDSRRKSLELNTLGSTEWIKKLFRVPTETGFVRYMNIYIASIRSLEFCSFLFCIIRHEPFDIPQRDSRLVTQNIGEFFKMFFVTEKIIQ